MNLNLVHKQANSYIKLTLCLFLFLGMISCQKNNTGPSSSQNKANTNTPDPRDAIVGKYTAADTIIFWGARVNATYQNYEYTYSTTLTISKDPLVYTNIILSMTVGADTKTWHGMNVIYGGNKGTYFNVFDQNYTTEKGLKYYIMGSTFVASPYTTGGVYDAYISGGNLVYQVTGNVSNYNYQGKIVNMPYRETIYAW